MAKPQSILGDVKGMARDFSMDSLPKGFVWDLVDYIPQQRGAQLEGRAPWTYLSDQPMGGTIWGGIDAMYSKGEKLLVAAGPSLYDQPRSTSMVGTQTPALIGALFNSVLQNGKFYYNKVYFPDGGGLQNPKYIDYDGASITISSLAGANTPKAKLLDVWKGRIITAGDPAQPEYIRWAPSPPQHTPQDAWDVGAYWGMDRAITALGPMANVCVVFHDGMTSRLRGEIPPATGLGIRDGVDITKDVLSNQYGCVDPASVVPWQENLIWACSHGVMLTDGSTVRSLTDQGGIGTVWRYLYALKRTGTQVSCGIYLNQLFVSVLTQWDANTTREDRSFTFVCDLTNRTWYRLTNVMATCMIPSSTGAEQLWFGTDTNPTQAAGFANRLARISPMYLGLLDEDPDFMAGSYPPAIDANQKAILPRITTGWVPLGATGQKRMHRVYVSHETQMQTPDSSPPLPVGNDGNVLKVGYRLTPVVLDKWVDIGGLPFSLLFDRKRLPVGRAGYGIQVHVEQVLQSHISRLYDIAVENWGIDRGRVS